MANFVEGDTESALRITCIDSVTSNVLNLSSSTIKIRWKTKLGVVKLKDMEIIDAIKGVVQYQFLAGELEPPEMSFDVIITNNLTNKIVTCENLVKILVRNKIN